MHFCQPHLECDRCAFGLIETQGTTEQGSAFSGWFSQEVQTSSTCSRFAMEACAATLTYLKPQIASRRLALSISSMIRIKIPRITIIISSIATTFDENREILT